MPGTTKLALGAALLGLGMSLPAQADSCRDWRQEHHHWKAESVRRYLDGSPQRELDSALFEMLQREAYLTSCAMPVEKARLHFVGWRLVGLSPEEYGRAVIKSLLVHSGMDLDLRGWFPLELTTTPEPVPIASTAQRRRR